MTTSLPILLIPMLISSPFRQRRHDNILFAFSAGWGLEGVGCERKPRRWQRVCGRARGDPELPTASQSVPVPLTGHHGDGYRIYINIHVVLAEGRCAFMRPASLTL